MWNDRDSAPLCRKCFYLSLEKPSYKPGSDNRHQNQSHQQYPTSSFHAGNRRDYSQGRPNKWPPPVKFYNKNEDYYEFTNFYMRPVCIDKYSWPSTEHYFQAQKFIGTPYMEEFISLGSPREAFEMSRRPDLSKWKRPDWEDVKLSIMYKALLKKFGQHEDLKKLLAGTGYRQLIENSPYDSYWGCGRDGKGANYLGRLLMKVRACYIQGSCKWPTEESPSAQQHADQLSADCPTKQFLSAHQKTDKLSTDQPIAGEPPSAQQQTDKLSADQSSVKQPPPAQQQNDQLSADQHTEQLLYVQQTVDHLLLSHQPTATSLSNSGHVEDSPPPLENIDE